MNTPNDARGVVEQTDRDAAALVMISREAEQSVRDGNSDTNPIVQAFARHRHAALASQQTGGEGFVPAIEKLREWLPRLREQRDTGRRTMGGGSISTDGGGGKSWGGEVIMAHINPDGPAVASAIEEMLATAPATPQPEETEPCGDTNASAEKPSSALDPRAGTKIAHDTDLIAVTRGVLGAAAYCVRKQAGEDSATYKTISAAAMSYATPQPASSGFVRVTPEWCLNMARLEGDAEIGAGMPDHPLRVDAQVQALLDDVPTNWDIQGYKSPGEEIADMANVGRVLMDRIAASISEGPLKGWSPMDCPTEIITDLLNMLSGQPSSGFVRGVEERSSISADAMDAVFDSIRDAYKAGAIDVHTHYQEDRDPDFAEAADDYGRSVIDGIATAIRALQAETPTVGGGSGCQHCGEETAIGLKHYCPLDLRRNDQALRPSADGEAERG